MAWDNLLMSINRAAKILNLDITEKDIPDSYTGLVKLNIELWNKVKLRRKYGICFSR